MPVSKPVVPQPRKNRKKSIENKAKKTTDKPQAQRALAELPEPRKRDLKQEQKQRVAKARASSATTESKKEVTVDHSDAGDSETTRDKTGVSGATSRKSSGVEDKMTKSQARIHAKKQEAEDKKATKVQLEEKYDIN
jgi:ribosome biogenesis protein ERB1